MESHTKDSKRKYVFDVSIIVPCKKIDSYVERCIFYCKHHFKGAELIVVTDADCPGYPAAKRNWAMARAKGSVYAFLDSDAFPSSNWLTCALWWLDDAQAVCGPGVLPPDAPYGECVADVVYQMLPYSYRVVPRLPRIVSE